MNQANQQAVIQSANMNLVQIRQIELDYFSSFFTSFGTQTALMIGFIVGSLSQVPGVDNPSGCHYFWIVLYWLTSAACVSSAIHCLVCTIFLEVFGQGLALRGPLGSMVRAVEGMIVEQKAIVLGFIFTIFMFGLQCIGMYWIMMDQTCAIIASIITFIAIFFWYQYALRLYNRFNWNESKVDWDEEDRDKHIGGEKDPFAKLDELDPSVLNKMHNRGQKGGRTGSRSVNFAAGSSNSAADLMAAHNNNDNASVHSVSTNALSGLESLMSADSKYFETSGGYLSLKTNATFARDPWQRKYFVVYNQLIYYYQDKRAFQLEPGKPINRRPIDVEGYTLIAGAVEPPYMISLVPMDPEDIRKTWKFRCDTINEFNNWIEIFTRALQIAQGGENGGMKDMAANAEFIKISDGKSEVMSRRGDEDDE